MLVFKIAVRYLLALRKASTVQILSLLSFLGILLGSLAMLLVLSAFNGFEDLLRRVNHFQDPDLRIEKRTGKFFELKGDTMARIRKVKHLSAVFEVLTDKASLQYGDGQMVVEIVGMDSGMVRWSRLGTIVDQGKFQLSEEGQPRAIVSAGIQGALNISFRNLFEYLKISYPKRKKILKLGTSKIFNQLAVLPGGILQTDENKVFLPIEEVRSLMDKPTGANFLELYVEDPGQIERVQEELSSLLGESYQVKNEYQQHSDLYKVLMIEKLFVFLALGFIILISTFNLFVSSTMLVLDKTLDIRILSALGMLPSQTSAIIRSTGTIITISGLVLGLFLGVVLCFIQKEFGIVPLGMSTTFIRDYPVEVKLQDLFFISLWVLISGFLAMIIPARRAGIIASELRSGSN